MKFKILKQKEISPQKQWFLCELPLFDYVNSLIEENFNFSIQRKIVANKYLDLLLNTIENSEPLPAITLAHYGEISNIQDDILEVSNDNIEILDGLQRTYRLWAYWKILEIFQQNKDKNLHSKIRQVKDLFPDFFERGIVDTKFFKRLDENVELLGSYIDLYKEYNVFFTIWTNLSENELVKKMLILNAGHKAVSIQHQFEILFLQIWKNLKSSINNITLYREKDEDFNRVKRGTDRQPGEYMFSTIITSLISLALAKPIRVSSDFIYKYDLHENTSNSSFKYAEQIFNTAFINDVLVKTKRIDELIAENSGIEGTKWFGKDTTLNGIFSGIGKYLKLDNIEIIDFERKVLDTIDRLENDFCSDLNLKEFNRSYDNFTGRSVNIGTLVRTIIHQYTVNRLQNQNISWSQLFKQENIK